MGVIAVASNSPYVCSIHPINRRSIVTYERTVRWDRTVIKLAKALKIPENTLLIKAGYTPNKSNDPTPSWWHRDTPPTDIELEDFLKSANIYFDGAPLNEEDKEDILTYLKVKWEREKKKREKKPFE